MDKEKIKEIRPYILPVITLVLVFTLFTFYMPGKNNSRIGDAITGFFAREPSYILTGSVELNNLNLERDNKCDISLEILSKEDKKRIGNYSLGVDQFLKKDDKYNFDLENLKIYLAPGNYLLDVFVYCDGKKTSESEQEITI